MFNELRDISSNINEYLDLKSIVALDECQHCAEDIRSLRSIKIYEIGIPKNILKFEKLVTKVSSWLNVHKPFLTRHNIRKIQEQFELFSNIYSILNERSIGWCFRIENIKSINMIIHIFLIKISKIDMKSKKMCSKLIKILKMSKLTTRSSKELAIYN